MEFTNQFHVPLPVEDAWKLMLDIPRVLPCLPGARLKEQVGENKYLGSITVRLGPIKLSFDGHAELLRKDDDRHVAWLRGSGLDPKGRGSAQSEFSFALAPAPAGGTDVTVTTQLQLSGAVAQYGRGSGMIAEVAAHILKQFEQNLAASLHGQQPPAAAVPARPAEGATQPVPSAPQAEQTPPTAPTATPTATPEAQALLLQAQAVLAQAQAVLAAAQQSLHRDGHPAARPAAPAPELNMLGIGAKAFWSQLKHAVGGRFSRR